MKYGAILVTAVLLPVGVYGQTAVSPSIQVGSVSEAPESSIDLLQKSIRTSGSTVAGVGRPAPKQKPKKEAAQTDEPVQAPVAEKAKSAPVATVTKTAAETKDSAAANKAATVEKTTIAPAATTPKAPATAAPAVEKSTAKTPAAGTPAAAVTPAESPVPPVSPTAATAPLPKQPLPPANVRPNVPASATRPTTPAGAKPTLTEQQIEQGNALLPQNAPAAPTQSPAPTQPSAQDLQAAEQAADAELEYAVKMLEASKAKAHGSRRIIPPSASRNLPSQVPVPNKKFNPNAFRPGVTWQFSKSTHFDIYTQKRSSGVPSSNMAMNFEASYQTLRRFIPWMMSGRVRVFIYQDHDSYLRYEPDAKAWSRAVAYPTRGEIVVYDEPGKTRELKEVFTHELTHIFTQQFFDKYKTGRIMTPTWLDEGLAVLLEDQAHSRRGGEWARDLKTLNFQRDPSQARAAFSSPVMFGTAGSSLRRSKRKGKPVFLLPFEQFTQENSLPAAEGQNRVQDWYFQAYAMVRFLLNPTGGESPSNRMQFEQFTRLIAQGEAVRNPSTGFLVKDARGQTVYEPYSVEKALGRAYRYNSMANFEDAFWRWADSQ